MVRMQMTNQTHNAPHIGQVMMAVERPGIRLLRFGQRKTVWPSSNSVFPIPNTIFRDTKSAMVGHSHCAPTAHLRQRWYCCESALSFFFPLTLFPSNFFDVLSPFQSPCGIQRTRTDRPVLEQSYSTWIYIWITKSRTWTRPDWAVFCGDDDVVQWSWSSIRHK